MIFMQLLCVVALSSPVQYAEEEVAYIFEVLYTQGAAAAEGEVLARDTTAYDFGLDLLAMGDQSAALSWFSAMAAADSSPQYIFGKTWVLREMGDFAAAMTSANQLTSDASEHVRARAHYLLGTIHREVGSHGYATTEFRQALSLFMALDKQGGVRLCRLGLGETDGKSIPTFPGSWPPPSDRDDS